MIRQNQSMVMNKRVVDHSLVFPNSFSSQSIQASRSYKVDPQQEHMILIKGSNLHQ
jgi:hypothetical protein